MSMIRLTDTNTPPPRMGLNVGAGLDIPTGYFIKDRKGNDVLLGGLSNLQGEMGDPNTDKTTLAIYMMLSGLNTIAYSYMSELMIYCSEGTLRVERINNLSKQFEHLDRNEYEELIMSFHSIAEITPEEWYDKVFADYVKKKRESKDYFIDIEFLNNPNDKTKMLKVKLPTGMLMDTITYFNPSTSVDLIMGEHEKKKGVGSNDSATKTIGLNDAKFKTDIMSTMTAATLRTNTYAMIVAHVGDNINLDNSPYGPKQRQQIGSLSSNEKIKGVPGNYTRLLTSLWQTTNKSYLYNQATKLAEYPLGNDMDTVKEELGVVTLKQHRSKDNMSRSLVEIVVSQKEGVLPHLSQFRMLKQEKNFGFEGNDRSYNLLLYPEVKLGRTTVRGLIDSDPKLRRALEFTADYLQMTKYFPEFGLINLYCGLDVLYKEIDAMGYDWNKIFLLTRNWWTPKQYTSELKYLHIINLLKIRVGLYTDTDVLEKIKKDK